MQCTEKRCTFWAENARRENFGLFWFCNTQLLIRWIFEWYREQLMFRKTSQNCKAIEINSTFPNRMHFEQKIIAFHHHKQPSIIINHHKKSTTTNNDVRVELMAHGFASIFSPPKARRKGLQKKTKEMEVTTHTQELVIKSFFSVVAGSFVKRSMALFIEVGSLLWIHFHRISYLSRSTRSEKSSRVSERELKASGFSPFCRSPLTSNGK